MLQHVHVLTDSIHKALSRLLLVDKVLRTLSVHTALFVIQARQGCRYGIVKLVVQQVILVVRHVQLPLEVLGMIRTDG